MGYREDFRSTEREGWWTLPRVFLMALFCLVALYGFGFLATGGDLAIYSFWAPKQANAENRVFHNTQAFTDGKITYIGRLCRERVDATGDQRKAIDGEIVNEAATIDNSKLPLDEQACISSAKGF